MNIYYIVAIFTMTVVLFSPLIVNSNLHTRNDSVDRVSYSQSIIRNGVPPLNPYAAGKKLHYYWFYDAVVALISTSIKIDIPTINVILNLIMLFLFLLVCFLTVRRICQNKERYYNDWLGVLLVIFGLNGWGWVFLIRNILLKNNPFYPPVGQSAVGNFLRCATFHCSARLGFFTTKFLIANTFPSSLSFMIIAFYMLIRFLKDRKPFYAIYSLLQPRFAPI